MADLMPRMLVIQDNEKLRRNLQQILGNAGYRTEAAASGEAGYSMTQEQIFDAMILDLSLPGRRDTV